MEEDIFFMSIALEEANLAAQAGEVPVGAVIVMDGQVVAQAHNLREESKSALAHAELIAIGKANAALGGWRLHKCTLYVTLEPCPMCAGALINCRMKRVVFGASDPKAGSFGSITDLSCFPFNHQPLVEGGVMGEECGRILTDFFRSLRDDSNFK